MINQILTQANESKGLSLSATPLLAGFNAQLFPKKTLLRIYRQLDMVVSFKKFAWLERQV